MVGLCELEASLVYGVCFGTPSQPLPPKPKPNQKPNKIILFIERQLTKCKVILGMEEKIYENYSPEKGLFTLEKNSYKSITKYPSII